MTCKIPVNRATLQEFFPGHKISLKRVKTLTENTAIRLVIDGVPRGANRDPSLAAIYQKVDLLKEVGAYKGNPICF